MPVLFDWILVVLVAVVWPLFEYFWLWPRHVRAVEAGDPTARSRVYAQTIFEQWGLTAAVLALTFALARPLASLGLRPPQGWISAVAITITMAYAILIVLQARALARKPATRARFRRRIQPLRALLPHTPGEFRRFILLSITAGICEELLFRGYLVWVLQSLIGLWPAAIVSMVVFGLGHAYQGRAHAPRAFLAGVFLGLLALGTRSILPGMALHALIDAGSGWVTHLAVRDGDDAEPAAKPDDLEVGPLAHEGSGLR